MSLMLYSRFVDGSTQDKLKNTINDEKLDDKCKELRSDIQNLQQLIE